MPKIDVERYEDDWEDEPVRRPAKSDVSQAAKDRIADVAIARVVAVDRGRLMIVQDGEVVPARFAGVMRRVKIVVGDRVRATPPKHEQDRARIVDVLDRTTTLTRTPDDDLDEERVVVANADRVAIVVSADHLRGGVGFVDRVLVSASAGGLGALIVINKMDLRGDDLDPIVDRYRAIGHEVLLTSAEERIGIEELRETIAGDWTAFTGHSGVGKSSLFNLLVPDIDQAVAATGRFGGRHTTVSSIAVPVPGLPDTWLVDTPGVRSFGLGTLAPEDLRLHYPEFRDAPCVKDDCLHRGDAGCAVASGEVVIAPERLDSYHRLLDNIQGSDQRAGREEQA